MLRYELYHCKQSEVTSITTLIADLKHKSADCEFQDVEFMIRDSLIMGTCMKHAQLAILRATNPTLEKSLKVALAAERVRENVANLTEKNKDTVFSCATVMPDYNIDYVQRQNRLPAQQREESQRHVSSPCSRCGATNHMERDCPRRNQECNFCHKKGHWWKDCRIRLSQPQRR